MAHSVLSPLGNVAMSPHGSVAMSPHGSVAMSPHGSVAMSPGKFSPGAPFSPTTHQDNHRSAIFYFNGGSHFEGFVVRIALISSLLL